MSRIDPFLRADAPEPDEIPRTGWGETPTTTNLPTSDPDWQPGDEIYGYGSGNYVRQLFQLMPDHAYVSTTEFWCRHCDVTWVREAEDGERMKPICWLCGRGVRNPGEDAEERAFRNAYSADGYGLISDTEQTMDGVES